jgi:general secretion pathway protein D
MANNKQSSLVVLSFAALVGTAFTGTGYAQFKKFQSKTEYNQQNDSEATSALLENAEELEVGEEDVFGRGNSVRPNSVIKKDNKYVNLNPDTAFGPEVVESFDFPNATLVDLTKHMQKLTGINLILDKDLKGRVSIMAPTPITVGDAWKAYLTALNTNGYTLVKSGAFYKIVNARDIRYTPTKIYTGTYTPDTENYVMRILPLKNIDSTEVTRSFRPFMSRYGRIIDIKQTNTIIVQDTGTNINRLVRLIRFIDVPGHEESLQIIKMKYSSAQEIAKLLDQILKANTGTRFKNAAAAGTKNDANNISKIIAEPRTNSIIAMANAEGSKQLRALISKLDVQSVASSGGQIHVYYLNHGDAETLSKTLSTLVSGAGATSAGGATSNFSKTRIPGAESNSLFGSDVKITADKDNNAVVVTASPTDYLTIKEVIKKLDIPRDQVYVEGLMMETQVSKNRAFGISIVGAYGSGGADKAGFTGGSNDLMNLLSNNITSLGGLFIGGGAGSKITQTVGGQEVEIKTVNGLITAIANSGNSNVLATPQILALDNTEAVFEVGETIPTPERTNAANGSSTVSIKQQKVALTLKITPQINKVTRFVKLKIDQKIEDFSNRSLPDGVASDGIATTTRSAVTTVVVRDKDTIAMGGLMRDKENFTENKVPLLGDIPVLGWLFKNTRKGVEKVNLLFFLTPKIIASYEKASAETVKDVLNRRNTHLKNIQGEDDPFGTTVKGLYDKAKKQEEGPLYDEEEASKYLRQNEGPGVTGGFNDDLLGQNEETPDYGNIVEQIKSKQSAVKKDEE